MIKKIFTAFICSSLMTLSVYAHDHKEGEHKSAHGGCLNAICECEVGHAEVKLEGDTLKVWFVGGGSDTLKAVKIPDKELILSVVPEGAAAQSLILKAVPNELSEESVGNCSQFAAKADFLKGVKKFTATGTVTFKGKKQPLRIEYPEGYDPDEDEDHDHDHKDKKEEKK